MDEFPVGPDRPGNFTSGGPMIQNAGNSRVGATPVVLGTFREEMIRNATLLTGGPNPKIVVPDALREVIAIFDNGITLIRTGESKNPEIRKPLQAAHNMGIGVSSRNTHTVGPEVLKSVYAAAEKASPVITISQAPVAPAKAPVAIPPVAPEPAPEVPTEFHPDMVRDVSLMTETATKNPKIQITEGAKRIVAIYENGVTLVARGEMQNAHYRAAMQSAMRLDVDVRNSKTFSVDPDVLIGIYKTEGASVRRDDRPQFDANEARRQIIISNLLKEAAAEGATDLHILVNKDGFANVRPRINNRLMKGRTLDKSEAMAVINAIFAKAKGVSGDSYLVMRQGALMPDSGLLPDRVEMIRLQYTPEDGDRGALAMRLKYRSGARTNDIESLGYSADQIKDLARMRRRTNGLYILAGKVSSGKSTTLQRMMNLMYEENNGEILIYTIEEPVELELHDAIQFTARNQKDPNDETRVIDGFEAGIMGSLRSDMNVAVLGEVRNGKVAEKGIELVLSGHALWTTIHAGSALRILGRLADLKVDKYKLADPDVIAGLIYQRLVGVLCDRCKVSVDEGARIGQLTEDLATMLTETTGMGRDEMFIRGPGCAHCKSGLKGRTVTAEVIMPDEKLLSIFATTGDPIQVKNYWTNPVEKGGMGGIPVIHHALIKVGAGICDINEVEQEINFLDFYVSEFPHLIERLHKDIQSFKAELAAKKA